MPESPDVNALKRRGRRRLVGAIALALLAVIVLPMVFDSEPRSPPPPVSVRIPGEDDNGFSPKVTPRGEAAQTMIVKPAPAPVAPAPPPAAETVPAEKPPARPEAKPAPAPSPEEKKRAENALADSGFVIPVAAFASPEKVRQLTDALAAARLPHYTEPIATAKGPVTRVRVGPFSSEAEARKAYATLQSLGQKPGPVTHKAQ